jgi:hypothetical protein
MTLWNFIADLFTQKAEPHIEVSIGPDRCQPGFETTAVRAGEHYIRIHLAQMFLTDQKQFLRNYRPAVHAVVRLIFGNQQIEIPHIADTSRIAGLEVKGGTVVAKNHALTPLLPFNGGDLALEAGLIGIVTNNPLAKWAKTLSDFSKILDVTQVSSFLKLAEPLALGIQNLFSPGSGDLHLGYHDAWQGETSDGNAQLKNPLKQGYIAVVDATANNLNRSQFYVLENELHYGPNFPAPAPLLGYDFMLFRISVTTERDDFMELTSIKEPYDQAITLLDNPLMQNPQQQQTLLEQAQTFLGQAKAKARTAPELTTAHRRIVREKIQEAFDQAKNEAIGQGLVETKGALTLNNLMAGIAPQEIADAAALGDPLPDEEEEDE